ncbi:MAG: phage baseplate assembly protein V [Polyangiales bacterium]
MEDNADPYKLGRLKLSIPDVLGSNTSGWALPCFPFAGAGTTPGSGVGLFLIPPADAWVWAEFEHGDPDKPIWTGCFFPADPLAMPAALASLAPLVGVDPAKKVLKVGKWVITVDDDSLTVEHLAVVVPRTRFEIDGTSVKLSTEAVPGAVAPLCATVEMSGNRVALNGSALEVT